MKLKWFMARTPPPSRGIRSLPYARIEVARRVMLPSTPFPTGQ